MSRGFFFTFEGVDGAGKTTQVAKVREQLELLGYIVETFREPGGTELGESVRALLLDSKSMPDKSELFLFMAARCALIPHIRAARAAGKIVILDRFTDSTYAYQGYGRGLDRRMIDDLETFVVEDMQPDHTWMLMVPEQVSNDRRVLRGGSDRIEAEAQEFKARVREGYIERARSCSDRVTVVDATPAAADVTKTLVGNIIRFMLSAGGE